MATALSTVGTGTTSPPAVIHLGGTSFAIPEGFTPAANVKIPGVQGALFNTGVKQTINGKPYEVWAGLASPLVTGTLGTIFQIVGSAGTIVVAPLLGVGEGLGVGAAAGTGAAEGAAGAGAAEATGAGATGGAAVKAAGTVASDAKTALTSAALISLITSLGFWIRVGETILGAVLLLLGLRAITTGDTSIPVPG